MAKIATKKRSSFSSDFSLEDLNYGIHRTKGISITPIKGFANLVAPLFDPSDSVEPFAMEAANLLGQSDQYGLYATQGMEAMRYEFALVRNIKQKYGIEGLNLNRFAMENKFTDAAKNVWKAIIQAFKTIIQAVSNFIKSVTNFIGGVIAKTQTKLLDKLDGGKIRYGKNLVTGLKQKCIQARMNEIDKVEEKVINAIEKDLGELEKASDMSFTTSSGGKKFVEEIAALYGGMGGKMGTTKFTPAQKWVNQKIFGAEKPETGKIAAQLAFDNAGGVEMLSHTSLVCAQNSVKEGKRVIKIAVRAVKNAEAASKLADRRTNAVIKDEKKKVTSDNKGHEYKDSKAQFGQVRYCASYCTGVLLATFSAFLKCRSFAAAAIRAGSGDRKSVV